jgi:hypothetical protein
VTATQQHNQFLKELGLPPLPYALIWVLLKYGFISAGLRSWNGLCGACYRPQDGL